LRASSITLLTRSRTCRRLSPSVSASCASEQCGYQWGALLEG
jgi:hypothetical protein